MKQYIKGESQMGISILEVERETKTMYYTTNGYRFFKGSIRKVGVAWSMFSTRYELITEEECRKLRSEMNTAKSDDSKKKWIYENILEINDSKIIDYIYKLLKK